MRIDALLILFAGVQAVAADEKNVLIEDELWYNRMIQEQISMSMAPTPVPTPCSNLVEQCPLSCWEVDEADRLPRCTDPSVNRPDCNELPFPTNLDPACPDCCPDECLDTEMEGCDPTPLPSPEPTQEPTPLTPEPTPGSNTLQQLA